MVAPPEDRLAALTAAEHDQIGARLDLAQIVDRPRPAGEREPGEPGIRRLQRPVRRDVDDSRARPVRPNRVRRRLVAQEEGAARMLARHGARFSLGARGILGRDPDHERAPVRSRGSTAG
jgi:hypothetical protein